ncbi:hypothetical protein [Leptospira wolffii]|uniref:hypothetical protein n=1 Tax=Leptospira wolffii TaxID=409998 RepID=UPI0002F4C926|nr:hypothetical protein [Leptospira wolffii]EPG66209.1 hypothetical protein LEP1GSC061_4184 [Leptospira wolffii serovar Khorat str. Khorat-H2]
MKEKIDHEVLFNFYFHADLLEEAFAEFKKEPKPLNALTLNLWLHTQFHHYEDIARSLPRVLTRIKSQEGDSLESEAKFEIKDSDLSIEKHPLLYSFLNRSFQSKQQFRKIGKQSTKEFWELQKEIKEKHKGPHLSLLEEYAKKVIRFNNELELKLIEYFGFNYKLKIQLDHIQ